jgi:hypothetical protein
MLLKTFYIHKDHPVKVTTTAWPTVQQLPPVMIEPVVTEPANGEQDVTVTDASKLTEPVELNDQTPPEQLRVIVMPPPQPASV